MSRILSCLVLMLVLGGCVVPTPISAPPVSAAPSAPAETGTYYFLAANNADPFYVIGLKGFDAAAQALGVKTAFVGPMDINLAAQLKTFEELIANPDTRGILWYALDFNAGEPLIKEAQAKGIPIVIGAGDSPYKTRSSFIGYDSANFGAQAAEVAAKAIDYKGSIGCIGIVTTPSLQQKLAAFKQHLMDNYPNIAVVPCASHDGSTASEITTLDAYLTAHPDLDLLWWSDAAAALVVQPWKDHQAAGVKTKFLATDLPQATLEAVRDGVYIATVGQDTYAEEYLGLYLMYNASHGLPTPDSVFLKNIVVTPANVAQYLAQ